MSAPGPQRSAPQALAGPGPSITRIVVRALASRGAAVAAACLLLAAFAARAQPDTAADAVDTRVHWIQVALFLLATFGIATVLETWPTLGRDRPDGAWIRRLHIGACEGAAHAFLAGMLVVLPLAVAVSVLFDVFARPGRTPALRESVELVATDGERLDPRHPRVDLVASSARFAEVVELRPVPVLGPDTAVGEARIDILIDGQRVESGPFHAGVASNLIRLAPARDVERLTMVWLGGDIALEWPLSTARMERTLATPRWLAAAGVGACTLIDLLVAAGAVVICRRVLATPILHFGAIAVLFLLQVTGTGTLGAAVAAHARDRLFLDAGTASSLRLDGLLLGLIVAAGLVPATLRNRRCVQP